MPGPEAVTELDGMTNTQVTALVGIGHHAARVLMINLEAAGTPPITMRKGRWVMLACHLRAASRPSRD